MARPTSYSPAVAEELCVEIASRSDSLDTICNERKEFPGTTTVYRWLNAQPEFRELYARAKEQQAQLLADQIIDIADTTHIGEIVTIKPDGEERKVMDMIEHRRLRIESRKWVAAKLLPKRYGDKVGIEHSGKLAVSVSEMTDEQLQALAAQLSTGEVAE